MVTITIHSERCKACGLCEAHCPRQLLHPSEQTNRAGYHPIVREETEECSGCGICALMCPDICFTIEKSAAQSRAHLRHEKESGGPVDPVSAGEVAS